MAQGPAHRRFAGVASFALCGTLAPSGVPEWPNRQMEAGVADGATPASCLRRPGRELVLGAVDVPHLLVFIPLKVEILAPVLAHIVVPGVVEAVAVASGFSQAGIV